MSWQAGTAHSRALLLPKAAHPSRVGSRGSPTQSWIWILKALGSAAGNDLLVACDFAEPATQGAWGEERGRGVGGSPGAHIPSRVHELFAAAWVYTQRRFLRAFQILPVLHIGQGAEGRHSLVWGGVDTHTKKV